MAQQVRHAHRAPDAYNSSVAVNIEKSNSPDVQRSDYQHDSHFWVEKWLALQKVTRRYKQELEVLSRDEVSQIGLRYQSRSFRVSDE